MAGKNRDATITLSVDGADSARQDIAVVEKAMQSFGDEGVRSTQRVVDSAKNIQEGWDRIKEKLAEGKAVTTRDVGVMAQQFEMFKGAIDRTGRSLDELPKEVQESYRLASAHVQEATKVVNISTNAAKDNAVALKETGNRLNDVGNVLDTVASQFGTTGQAIGNVVGRLGNLAATAEQAKDVTAGLNLNTLSLKSSAAALAVQATAVAGAFIAAAAAGKKLSETNEENAEAWRDLAEIVKAPTKQMAEDFGLLQREAGKIAGAFAAMTTNGAVGFEEYAEQIHLSAIRLIEGEEAANRFAAALALGIDRSDAAGLSVEQLNAALTLHTKIVDGGAEAQKICAEESKKAAGDTELLIAAVDRAAPRIAALAKAQQEAEKASGGSSKAIRELVAEAEKLLPAADKNAVALGNLASRLQELLSRTDGLSAAERIRIQTLIDLLKKSDDLKVSEEDLAKKLADSILKQKEATESTKETAKAREEAAEATKRAADAENMIADALERTKRELGQVEGRAKDGTTPAINKLMEEMKKLLPESDLNTVALGKLARQLQENLDKTDGLTAAQRKQIQELINLTKRGDELTESDRKRVAQLKDAIETGQLATEQLKEETGAKKALAEATDKATEAERRLFDERQKAIEQTKERIALIEQELELRTRELLVGHADDPDILGRINSQFDAYRRLKQEQEKLGDLQPTLSFHGARPPAGSMFDSMLPPSSGPSPFPTLPESPSPWPIYGASGNVVGISGQQIASQAEGYGVLSDGVDQYVRKTREAVAATDDLTAALERARQAAADAAGSTDANP